MTKKTFDSVDPSTEKKIAQVASASEEDVNIAVSAAREALNGKWKKVSGYERGILINKLADDIEKSKE